MLNRLGLVIHMVGWALATLVLLSLTMNYKGYFWNCGWGSSPCGSYIRVDVIIIGLGIAGILILGSWAIRFILAGHKSPLPWVANKETKQ
jgi:phage-related minor tail protein